MSVIIKSKLDTTGVKDGTAALQSGLKQDIGEALNKVQQEAQKTEGALKGMFDLQKIQAAAGAFGAAKSILEKTGVAALGLSESTNKAVTSTLDMASQGVALGAVFGPVGAAIGGATGALLGWITASEEAAKAEEELTKKLAAEAAKREEIRAKEERASARAFYSSKVAYQELSSALGDATKAITASSLSTSEQGDLLRARRQDVISLAKAWDDYTTSLTHGTEAEREEAEIELSRAMKGAAQDIVDINAALGDYAKAQSDAANASNAATTAAREQNAEYEKKHALFVANFIKQKEQNDLDAKATELRKQGNDAFAAYQQKLKENAELAARVGLEITGTLALPDLSTDKLDLLEEGMGRLEAKAREVGEALKESLVNVGVGAAKTLFSNIEAGKKPLEGLGKAFAKLASEELKGIGTSLIGEGLRDELKAASMLVSSLGALSGPAAALAGIGAAKIAVGLGMGGIGALLGRRGNHSAADPSNTQSDSLGSREVEASAPKELAPVKIFLGPEHGWSVIGSADKRGLSEFGSLTLAAQDIAKKAPR